MKLICVTAVSTMRKGQSGWLVVDMGMTSDSEDESEPVTVEAGSIRFRPSQMELGRYYVVTFNAQPFLYRRINDAEVEVYGLADQNIP